MDIQVAWFIFCFYLAVLLGVGLYGWRRRVAPSEFLLADRRLACGTAAVSAQVSEVSGWLFLGLPGAVYFAGSLPVWIAGGLLLGSILNWLVTAPRLRIAAEQLDVRTVPEFLERRFGGSRTPLRRLAAATTLVCFIGYAAGGLAGSAEILSDFLGIDYRAAVLTAALAIALYTVPGGFPAVCRTDLLQGLLMLAALVVLPGAALLRTDWSSLAEAGAAGMRDGGEWTFVPGLFPGAKAADAVGRGGSPGAALLSGLSWGIGFFGLPHVLSRFMAVKSARLLPRASLLAALWTATVLTGAVLTAWAATAALPHLSREDSPRIFLDLCFRFFTPYVGGMLLAAAAASALAAMDAMLLAAGAVAGEDLCGANPQGSEDACLRVRRVRIAMPLLLAPAVGLALHPFTSAAELLAAAWAGFGAVFAPAVLAALYLRRATAGAVFGGMLTALLTLAVWRWTPLAGVCYEIIPGFLLNCAVIALASYGAPQRDRAILHNFKRMENELKETFR